MTTRNAKNDKLRNIAIIAHVDHGKTTLVDFLFRQSGLFRENANISERVMDSMDLEKERGITISAKNCSVFWRGIKINILDTPGHADFGGEVERALMMVDGAILLVDAAEGPLPQTRFVLQKALELNLKIIVCLNKIDRHDARPQEVLNQIYDLFIDLDADDEQIEFPVLYAIAKDGIAKRSLGDQGVDLTPLFETVCEMIPGPSYDPAAPFQMLVANIGYSDYLGSLAIGKVINGSSRSRDALIRINKDGKHVPLKVVKLQTYNGITVKEVEEALPGEIILLAGVDQVEIGDTICTLEAPQALKRITVEEPTISMTFTVNNSPFSGREGSIVQGKRIAERLKKEGLYNVSLRIEASPGEDSFVVMGRGELLLAILIETMRREGFELSVGRPRIIYKQENGQTLEPIEHLYVDCEEFCVGIVTEKLSMRKGRMINLINHGTGRVRIEFSIPSRGLIGYRGQFLTDTRGTGLMNSYLSGYEPERGDFPTRTTGSLVADREGEAVPYALFHLEPRGKLIVRPHDPVYEGMVVGEHNRANDLNVNPCKTKKLSNMRAAGKDENIMLTPVVPLTIDQAISFIREDELVEVTPKSIRIRKVVLAAGGRKELL